MAARDASDEYVHIPKRLILKLLRDEGGLSSLPRLPSHARAVIENCAETIREIAASAGLTVAGESSSSSIDENRLPAASPVTNGTALFLILSICRRINQITLKHTFWDQGQYLRKGLWFSNLATIPGKLAWTSLKLGMIEDKTCHVFCQWKHVFPVTCPRLDEKDGT